MGRVGVGCEGEYVLDEAVVGPLLPRPGPLLGSVGRMGRVGRSRGAGRGEGWSAAKPRRGLGPETGTVWLRAVGQRGRSVQAGMGFFSVTGERGQSGLDGEFLRPNSHTRPRQVLLVLVKFHPYRFIIHRGVPGSHPDRSVDRLVSKGLESGAETGMVRARVGHGGRIVSRGKVKLNPCVP